jgi:hypothetical protein
MKKRLAECVTQWALTALRNARNNGGMEHIFDIWPTTGELARDLGVPYTTAASWRVRGNIPAKHDLDLVAAAAARGRSLTLESLAAARRTAAPEAPKGGPA